MVHVFVSFGLFSVEFTLWCEYKPVFFYTLIIVFHVDTLTMTTKVKGQYALVVYEKPVKKRGKESATGSQAGKTFYDVLELSLIPKKHRVEGDKTRVTWVDSSTKQSSCHYVTIKKISANRDELLNMYPVDARTGEIADKETKIFTEDIHKNKKEIQVAKKTEKIARNTAQDKIETTISNDQGICASLESEDLNIQPSALLSVEPTSSAVCTSTSSNVKLAPSDRPRVKSTSTVVSASKPANVNLVRSLETVPSDRRQVKSVTLPPSVLESSPLPSPELPLSDDGSASPKSTTKDLDEVEGRYAKFWATMKDLAVVATPENISFLASVVESLKASDITPRSRSSIDQNSVYEIPNRYKIPGKDKVPIFDGIDFYLFEGVKNAIERKSYVINKDTLKPKKSWQLLVRSCLIEVYGSTLGQYSAKGTKDGRRPAIQQDVYRGLLYWSRQWSCVDIDEPDFISFINKTAYNKRKAQKQKDSEKFVEMSSLRQQEKTETKSRKGSQKKKQQDPPKETKQQEQTVEQHSKTASPQENLSAEQNAERQEQSVEQRSKTASPQENLSTPPTKRDQAVQKQPVRAAPLSEGVIALNTPLQYPSYHENAWYLPPQDYQPSQNFQRPQNYQPPQRYQLPQNYQPSKNYELPQNGQLSQNYQPLQNYPDCNQLQQYGIPEIPLYYSPANKPPRFSTEMEYEDLS